MSIAPPPPPLPPPLPGGVFYQSAGIRVTSAIVDIHSKTYSLANITSVETGVIQPPSPGVGCQVMLIILGSLLTLISFGVFGSDVGTGFVLLLIGGAGLAGGIYWLTRVKAPAKIYVVRLQSASTETEALRSTDATMINAVANAIRQAIAARG